MNTIQDKWEEFEKIMEIAPSEGKYLKRIFYAGAHACMLVHKSASNPTLSDAAGLAMIENLAHEIKDFAQAIQDDKA